MKKIFLLTLIFVCVFSGSVYAEGKTLVAYFSWSGNTAALAKNIADETGSAVLDVAKKEQNRKARPELANHVQDMAQYDTIFLGYPCWWGNMPMAVFTFLEEYDFSGKRVIPFVTHGGSSFGRSLNDMKETIPNAKIESNGLSVHGTASHNQIVNWLNELGFSVKN